MNKRGTSLIFLSLLLFALTIGLVLQSNPGLTEERLFNITNHTAMTIHNISKNLNIEVQSAPELGNALTYFLGGTFDAVAELVIWVSNFTYANPDAPYKLLIFFLFLSIFTPIIIALFKLGIIIYLLIREKMQSKKERGKFKR